MFSLLKCGMDDSSLLKSFVEAGDERAFRELVDRHIDLVYSSARRQVHDGHLAEDVTQAVFVVLARKAATLKSAAVLPAWLLATTRFVAHDVMRTESRRRKREQEAAQTMSKEPENPAAALQSPEVAPLIDDALARLREGERILVTLRYLKGMSLAEVASAAGISIDACEKRISRAIAKLRDSFQRRGVALPASAIAIELGKAFTQAPTGLANRAAEAALSARSLVGSGRAFRWQIAGASGTGVAAAAAAVLLAAGVIVAAVVQNFGVHSQQFSGGTSSIAVVQQKIKVGVLLSEFTASDWHPSNDSPYDLSHQKIVFYLRSPKLDVYAILEPGPNPTMRAQMPRTIAADHIIDGADYNALRKLDVIVAGHNWHMRQPVLDAMDQGVSDGVGLLEQAGFAKLTPSFTEQVCELSAMKHAELFSNAAGGRCVVVASHPLLGNLKPGDEMICPMLYGAIGPLTPDASGLIAAPGLRNGGVEAAAWEKYVAEKLHRPATAPSSGKLLENDLVFFPLYIGQHGKGRIVACQWHDAPPAKLDPNNDGTFYLHCIQWLAGRPIE